MSDSGGKDAERAEDIKRQAAQARRLMGAVAGTADEYRLRKYAEELDARLLKLETGPRLSDRAG